MRETVPDSVLERADEIELIDIPPDDLRPAAGRGQGLPARAGAPRDRATSSRKGNLTALRELALRVAAERVDAQMVHYMRAHAIPGPWPAQDRILFA